ncbi:hypothetical protein ACH5RR_023123, partial [Cinchona calisaya]
SQVKEVSFAAATQGEWRFLQESIGISAMHMQLLHNNKVIMFDRTDFGESNISLPHGRCRRDPHDQALKRDCTAHSVLYDIGSNSFRPLMVQTDTWCSSGAVLHDGTLIQTGGYNDGDRVVRRFHPCNDDYCDWIEFPNALSRRRWYASNQILTDGRIVIVGGRGQFNYEFYTQPPNSVNPKPTNPFNLDFLRETMDRSENNLYPFLYLLPDGNLFIFANTRSIIFDYHKRKVVREFPPIPGGFSRNYPSTGSSVLLPINDNGPNPIEAEVMVCGGAHPKAFNYAMRKVFMRASSTCGRLKVTDKNPSWKMETMPLARVMGDMLLLPDGDVIIINGASSGAAGFELARNPVTRPVIYQPNAMENNRFWIMETAKRPRMYHSCAVLLLDGRVLIGGSNPHALYNFTAAEFPTELSLEAFYPPYLAARHDHIRPRIVGMDEAIVYQKKFSVTFKVENFRNVRKASVRIIAPSFTTHSFAMNQRMVVLKKVKVVRVGPSTFRIIAVGPSTPELAPKGYYMLFVVHAQIPSEGMWMNVGSLASHCEYQMHQWNCSSIRLK